MKNKRKSFLNLSTLFAYALVLPVFLFSCGSNTENQEEVAEVEEVAVEETAQEAPLDKYGIQLWSVKEQMAEDPKGTLKKLASYGYKQVESFDGPDGIFWGMTNTEFKSYLDELGMTMVAAHVNTNENFEEKARQASEIGMEYVISPYVGPQETLEDYRALAKRFNELGAIAKKHGIRFAYHNHDYTFEEVEGQIPHKILLEETDPELVDFELDLYWVVVAGENPVEYFENYGDRFPLVHVKDRRADATAEETHASTVLGTGAIDYTPILKAAKANGVEYYFVEQEEFKTAEPMESAELNAGYMKTLSF